MNEYTRSWVLVARWDGFSIQSRGTGSGSLLLHWRMLALVRFCGSREGGSRSGFLVMIDLLFVHLSYGFLRAIGGLSCRCQGKIHRIEVGGSKVPPILDK